jgi:hypothetical protein
VLELGLVWFWKECIMTTRFTMEVSRDIALMTCHVEELADGHHIHLVDGGGGVDAMAATRAYQMQGAT